MHTILRPDGRATEPNTIIKELEILETYGASLHKYSDIKKARAAHARWKQLRTEAGELSATSSQTIEQTASALAAGTISTADLHSAAVAATLAASASSALHQIYDQASVKATNEVVHHLRALGDKWITDILRPLIAEQIARLMDDVADPARIHPSNPYARDLLTNRHEALEAHSRIRELHAKANFLRELRIIPASKRRTDAWEWGLPAELRGQTEDTIVHFVAHTHAGHEPGIYTDREVAEAEQHTLDTLNAA